MWAHKKNVWAEVWAGKKKRPHKKKDEGAKKKCGRNCAGKKVDANRPHLFFESCGRFLIFLIKVWGAGAMVIANTVS